MKQLLITIFWLYRAAAGTPELPRDVAAQWSKFQAALKSDDLSTLTAMTRFPLDSNEFGGTIKSPKVFRSRYKIIFTKQTKKCMLNAPLDVERSGKKIYYEVYCDDVSGYPIMFYFTKVGTKLLLTSIDNINE